MYVFAGKYKSKKLEFVSNPKVRPITAKVREALFAIWRNKIEEAMMLDLFCGSGGVGIEALSRGAKWVDFIDLDTKIVSRNIINLKIENQRIYKKDVFAALAIIAKKNKKYDLIFIGAPYAYDQLKDLLVEIGQKEILTKKGELVVEYPSHLNYFSQDFETLKFFRTYQYGQTNLGLYQQFS